MPWQQFVNDKGNEKEEEKGHLGGWKEDQADIDENEKCDWIVFFISKGFSKFFIKL